MPWDSTREAERLLVINGAQAIRPSGWSDDGGLVFELFGEISLDIGMLSPERDGSWKPLTRIGQGRGKSTSDPSQK